MAGLNVAPDAEEAALDDAADAAASAPPAGPVVTYERYAKTVQAAFSRSVAGRPLRRSNSCSHASSSLLVAA